MTEQIEQYMRTLKLGGLAKEWRSISYYGDPEQYVNCLLYTSPGSFEIGRSLQWERARHQVPLPPTCPDPVRSRQRQLELLYPAPVSYTHLDVYKRQE